MKAADVVKKSVWAVLETGKSQSMARTLPYVAGAHAGAHVVGVRGIWKPQKFKLNTIRRQRHNEN